MDIQYKPSKQKKVKQTKAEKSVKAAPMSFGSAKSVKIDKPKAQKAPKPPKAPKPEKVKEISFGKPGKVEKAANASGMQKPLKPAVIISIIAVLAVVVLGAVTYIILSGPASGDYESDMKKLTIVEQPLKTEYYVGQRVMYEGLKLSVTMKNGEVYSVRPEDCTITGFDSSQAGTCLITVSYQNLNATFSVIVKERPASTSVLVGISLETEPKKEYKLGEYLDTSGGVLVRHYKDGTTARLSMLNSYVQGFEEINAPGEYVLTIEYIENGFPATCTYTITVTE